MASIFNDLGKKLSSASQDAVKKAKELAEVAKLNGSILDEERKINKYYTQIGEKYVELFSNTEEEPFATFIKKIEDSKLNIKKHRNDINMIKNVKSCSSCGATFTGEAAFCSSCGEKHEEPEVVKEDIEIVDEDMEVVYTSSESAEETTDSTSDIASDEETVDTNFDDTTEEPIIVEHVVDETIEGSDI